MKTDRAASQTSQTDPGTNPGTKNDRTQADLANLTQHGTESGKTRGDSRPTDAHPSLSKSQTWALLLRGAFYCLSLIPVAAFLTTYFADRSWLLDLLNNFQLQLWVAQAPCLALALVLRRWRLSTVLLIPFLLCGWGVTDVYRKAPSPMRGQQSVKIMSANVFHLNRDYREMVEIIEQVDPDVLVLIELSPVWLNQLQPIHDRYPHQILLPRYMGAGMGILSKLELDEENIVQLSPEYRDCPVIRARIRIDDRPLDLFAVHPVSPRTRQQGEIRDYQIEKLSSLVTQSESPKIVIGDFNTSSWTPSFQSFKRSSGLRDSRDGFGLLPTWPSDAWWAQIAIDHALVSPDVAVTERSVHACSGSDHLPISLTVGWATDQAPSGKETPTEYPQNQPD